jgi:hypothetical protein
MTAECGGLGLRGLQPLRRRVASRRPASSASPVAPALNDHQARGHHDERNQRGQDHDQQEGHRHLRCCPSRELKRTVTSDINRSCSQ